MRILLPLVLSMALAAPAAAQDANGEAGPEALPAGAGVCLSETQIQAEVAARRVVSQLAALKAASAASGGEAVRARLCRQVDNALVYAIVALKKDGKVVHVMVEGATGQVVAAR